MKSQPTLQLLGVKQLALGRINSLDEVGCLQTSATTRCLKCAERYSLLIDPRGSEADPLHMLDLAAPIKELTELITREHSTGHGSELLVIEFELLKHAAAPIPRSSPYLHLRPGERISACWRSSALRDCSACSQCQRPAFRIVRITQAPETHRYVSLCEDHFADRCLLMPELADAEFEAIMGDKQR